MNRRDALRAATALTAGTLAAGAAGCAPNTPATPTETQRSGPAPSPSATAPGAAPGAPAVEIQHGPRDRPRVALTFHGQGDAGIVSKLLDEFDRGGVKVTVLAVGTWLAAEPVLARRVVAAGHELGNHTQHHADIKRMAAEQAYAEIDECAKRVKAITGSIGRWFRPSQTRLATPTIKAAAARAGYAACLSYDVDSLDYTDPAASAVVATTLRAVQPGSIISMHFGHLATIAAMSPLLSGLRDRGLAPVTVSELVG